LLNETCIGAAQTTSSQGEHFFVTLFFKFLLQLLMV